MNPLLSLETLSELQTRYAQAAAARVAEFSIGTHSFHNNAQPYLMGVVNLSADSWYRESVCLSADAAIRRGHILHESGAAIIDIGAESSLAQAARVSAQEQKSALLPVVTALAQAGICVSVETYQPEVTRACLQAGARVLNLTGSVEPDSFFHEVADHDAGVIICFVQGNNVRDVGDLDLGTDPVETLYAYFGRMIDHATRCGVKRIWIDPGLGFYYRNLQDSATRIRHQISIFLNSFRLRTLGWPVCHALPHAFECFEDEVRCAEPFFAVPALLGKTDLLRTHEINRVRGVMQAMRL